MVAFSFLVNSLVIGTAAAIPLRASSSGTILSTGDLVYRGMRGNGTAPVCSTNREPTYTMSDHVHGSSGLTRIDMNKIFKRMAKYLDKKYQAELFINLIGGDATVWLAHTKHDLDWARRTTPSITWAAAKLTSEERSQIDEAWEHTRKSLDLPRQAFTSDIESAWRDAGIPSHSQESWERGGDGMSRFLFDEEGLVVKNSPWPLAVAMKIDRLASTKSTDEDLADAAFFAYQYGVWSKTGIMDKSQVRRYVEQVTKNSIGDQLLDCTIRRINHFARQKGLKNVIKRKSDDLPFSKT